MSTNPRPGPGVVVVRVGVLLGVGDEDVAVEVPDPERGVAVGDGRIDESARRVHLVEVAVEDVHAPFVESVA